MIVTYTIQLLYNFPWDIGLKLSQMIGYNLGGTDGCSWYYPVVCYLIHNSALSVIELF